MSPNPAYIRNGYTGALLYYLSYPCFLIKRLITSFNLGIKNIGFAHLHIRLLLKLESSLHNASARKLPSKFVQSI